jgi:hypothetical protein
MKAKVQLLLKKMKSSHDISWNEKEELKYKGETVQESNVVDLVNDVLSKRKYFNPQGWETFGEALRYLGLHCFWYVFQNFVVDQVLFHGFRYDCHGSGSVIVVDIQISSERLVETEGKKSRTGSTFKTEVETTKGQL